MVPRWVLGAALVLGTGCGGSADTLDEAKGHVQRALEHWEKGGNPAELKSLSQPIEFNEALWDSGEKLIHFEIGTVKFINTTKAVRCETRLTLRNRKLKDRTETVVYDVTLASPVKIVNNPMP